MGKLTGMAVLSYMSSNKICCGKLSNIYRMWNILCLYNSLFVMVQSFNSLIYFNYSICRSAWICFHLKIFLVNKKWNISIWFFDICKLEIESPCILLLPNISKMINLNVANKAMKWKLRDWSKIAWAFHPFTFYE